MIKPTGSRPGRLPGLLLFGFRWSTTLLAMAGSAWFVLALLLSPWVDLQPEASLLLMFIGCLGLALV